MFILKSTVFHSHISAVWPAPIAPEFSDPTQNLPLIDLSFSNNNTPRLKLFRQFYLPKVVHQCIEFRSVSHFPPFVLLTPSPTAVLGIGRFFLTVCLFLCTKNKLLMPSGLSPSASQQKIDLDQFFKSIPLSNNTSRYRS
jgi:hypothetical protein